jgi:hypothetical protein
MGNDVEPLTVPIGMFIKRLKAGVIAQKSRSDKGGAAAKKGAKKGGMVRRNSFVLAHQVRHFYSTSTFWARIRRVAQRELRWA